MLLRGFFTGRALRPVHLPAVSPPARRRASLSWGGGRIGRLAGRRLWLFHDGERGRLFTNYPPTSTAPARARAAWPRIVMTSVSTCGLCSATYASFRPDPALQSTDSWHVMGMHQSTYPVSVMIDVICMPNSAGVPQSYSVLIQDSSSKLCNWFTAGTASPDQHVLLMLTA